MIVMYIIEITQSLKKIYATNYDSFKQLIWVVL